MPSFMRRITPSAGTAIAFTALLIALSGTAVALPGKNKVEGNDIRKNALTATKIKANSVNRREGQGQQPDRRGHPGDLAGHGAVGHEGDHGRQGHHGRQRDHGGQRHYRDDGRKRNYSGERDDRGQRAAERAGRRGPLGELPGPPAQHRLGGNSRGRRRRGAIE